MGSRLGAVARVARLAKTHGSLAPIDPWLTQMMERVRTGAVVDVPKGTVVVGDRRRAPRAEQGVRSSARIMIFLKSRAPKLRGARTQKVGCWTAVGDVKEHPVPLRRTLVRIHGMLYKKSALWYRFQKVFVWAGQDEGRSSNTQRLTIHAARRRH